METKIFPIINPIIYKVTSDKSTISRFYYEKSELYGSPVTHADYISKIPVLIGNNYEKTGGICRSDIVGYVDTISYREASIRYDSLYFEKYFEKYKNKEIFLLMYPKISSHSLVNRFNLDDPFNYRKVESISCAVLVDNHLVACEKDPRIKIIDDSEEITKRSDYILWDEYFMGIAKLSSMRSKDPNTQVGCCIVKDNRILSMGYNGFPNGCSDDDFPWGKNGDDELNTKYLYVTHSELNAILNYKGSLEGSTLYVTLFPCNECSKAIIQSGIKKIIYIDDKDSIKYIASKRMLDSAGVKYEKYTPTNRIININV